MFQRMKPLLAAGLSLALCCAAALPAAAAPNAPPQRVAAAATLERKASARSVTQLAQAFASAKKVPEAIALVQEMFAQFDDANLPSIGVDRADDLRAAFDAYDSLTDEEKMDCGLEPMKLIRLRRHLNDLGAVASLNTTVARLPDASALRPDDIEAVRGALDAYRALSSDDARHLVDSYQKLEALEAELSQNTDLNQAFSVYQKINALGTVAYPASGPALSAAREAFDALSERGKAYVTNLAALEQAEAAYAAQEQAVAFTAQVEAVQANTFTRAQADNLRDAYGALSPESIALLSDECKNKYSAIQSAVMAADGFDSAVRAIGPVTLEKQGEIEALTARYAAFDAWTKALITQLDTLNTAQATLNALLSAKQSAQPVIEKIDAIGSVTLESEPAITQARQAYDALSPQAQGFVTNLSVLEQAERLLALLEEQSVADQEAANRVVALINGIDTVTLQSKPKIDAAVQAFNALPESARPYVTNADALKAAQDAYDALVIQDGQDRTAAAQVDELIDAIGPVTLESGPAIEAAQTAYDALNDAARQYVKSLGVLSAAKTEYARLTAQQSADQAAAAEADRLIDAIGTVTLDSKAAIEAALAAYDQLNDNARAMVTLAETLQKAKTAYDALAQHDADERAAAEAAQKLIARIGTVTLDSKAAIEAARGAYDALSEYARTLVQNAAELEQAETAYAALVRQDQADRTAAARVVEAIRAIGVVTRDSKEAIEQAEAAYAALTAAQKRYVSNYADLVAAHTAYADLITPVPTGDASLSLMLALALLASGGAFCTGLTRRKRGKA